MFYPSSYRTTRFFKRVWDRSLNRLSVPTHLSLSLSLSLGQNKFVVQNNRSARRSARVFINKNLLPLNFLSWLIAHIFLTLFCHGDDVLTFARASVVGWLVGWGCHVQLWSIQRTFLVSRFNSVRGDQPIPSHPLTPGHHHRTDLPLFLSLLGNIYHSYARAPVAPTWPVVVVVTTLRTLKMIKHKISHKPAVTTTTSFFSLAFLYGFRHPRAFPPPLPAPHAMMTLYICSYV